VQEVIETSDTRFRKSQIGGAAFNQQAEIGVDAPDAATGETLLRLVIGGV
jgi:hypothetical protein